MSQPPLKRMPDIDPPPNDDGKVKGIFVFDDGLKN